MKISVNCAACGSTFQVNEQYAGQRFACRQCRAPLDVPALAPAPAARAAESEANDLLRIKCAHCGKPAKADPSLIGRQVRCKGCGQAYRVEIGGPSQPTARPASAPPLGPSPIAQRGGFDVDSLVDPEDGRGLMPTAGPHNLDPLLSALDDVPPMPPALRAPLAPLRPAPVRPSPKRRRRRLGPEIDMSATLDGALSILGLLYALASIGGVIFLYQNGGFDLALVATLGCISLAHGLVYLLALVRIGSNGSAGFAVLCFFLPCIGEIMALVASSNHTERWRMERLLPAWTFLFIAFVITVFAVKGRSMYIEANDPQLLAAQNTAIAPPTSGTPAPQQSPGMPPSPLSAPARTSVEGSEELVELKREKAENAEATVAILRSVIDPVSAAQATARHKELTTQRSEILVRHPPGSYHFTGDRQRRYSEYHEREKAADTAIAQEKERIRAIPGAAQPLGLTPSQPTTNVGAASGRKSRPEPTTTDEEITRAVEDLGAKSPFERRDAAAMLKRMPVDESRREEVARALGKMLDDRDPFFQESVSAALIDWATPENVPQLVRVLSAKSLHSETNHNCMQALARLKDKRGADAVAKMLFTRDFQPAIVALKEMGPLAEDAVLPLLDNEDPALRREVCGILEEVGTSKSVKDLRRHLSGDRGTGVREAARRAITAIEDRDGPPKRK